jgi:eukaryotic-like serine/threonine-protein kinase
MPLATGARLGPYEVLAPLGAGGMGEVYKARDSRLDRLVAIKILPPALAADPAARDRFTREAKAVAAISHPNILAIHDVGTEGDVAYAVTELLDGETLRERLTASAPRGLPARKAIDCALQVARGLAAAHEKGIVHRDLKPENIFLTTDGRTKILDFGLAKQQIETPSLATITPTFAQGTTPGTILGTIGYMSPEQVRGQTVDHRADIFALGAVLYEMVSGRRAFPGDTAADTISAIIHLDPPELPQVDPSLPSALDRVVRRCIEKQASERFHSAHDFGFALEAIAGATGSSPSMPRDLAAPVIKRGRATPLVAVAVAAASLVLGAAAAWLLKPAPAVEGVLKLSILPPDKVDVTGSLALSPDGQTVAFVGVGANAIPHLWIRRVDALDAKPLEGTDDAAFPFWSPDGRSLGFFAGGRLKRVELAGGASRVLCAVSDPRGGTWNASGVIVFAPHSGAGLFRVSAEGGTPAALTNFDPKKDISHRWPRFLPDGRHIFFMSRHSGSENQGRLSIWVTDLDAPDEPHSHQVVASSESTAYFADGLLYFLRSRTMFAQPFDVARLQTTAEATPVAEHVFASIAMDGLIAFDVARGTLVYRSADDRNSRLTWFDRSGRPTGVLGPPGAANATVSRDGRAVAFDVTDALAINSSTTLWSADVERGTTTRLMPPTSDDSTAAWSPDGAEVVFASDRAQSFDLYVKPIGQAPERLLLKSSLWKYPESWSPDGRTLIFSQIDPQSRMDLMTLSLRNPGQPAVFVKTEADEWGARFSPDGRWVAYASTESGRPEVYVRAFPLADARSQISVDGGRTAAWRGDGAELYYLGLDNRIMAASVNGRGAVFQAGTPVALFQARIAWTGGSTNDRPFTASPGGDRFLINQLASDMRASAINVVIDRGTAKSR